MPSPIINQAPTGILKKIIVVIGIIFALVIVINLMTFEIARLVASDLYEFGAAVESTTWKSLAKADGGELYEMYETIKGKLDEYIDRAEDDFFMVCFQDIELRTALFSKLALKMLAASGLEAEAAFTREQLRFLQGVGAQIPSQQLVQQAKAKEFAERKEVQ